MNTFSAFFKFLFSLLFTGALLYTAPFAIFHMLNHWNAPEAMHSGATPDCPTWHQPNN